MRGGDDFKAAIEEQKRRARDEYERKRSGSWQGKEELVSPTIPDMEPLGMFSGIPGLGNGRPTVETTVETLGSRQASENQSSKDVERDLKSPISPTDGDKPRQSSMTTGYAGLVSARKRKHDGSSSNVAETASSRRKSVVSKDGGEGTSGRPFAPPKKLPRGARPAYDEIESIDTRTTSKPSSWYDSIDVRQKFSRSDLNTVQYINTLIRDCQKEATRSGDLTTLFAKIRQRLHQMEFYDFLGSGVIVKKSKVLEDSVGLPQIFYDAGGVGYPWDLQDDAQMLYSKWMQGILDPHLLRGIESVRKQRAAGKSTISHRLQPDYPGRVSCNVVGENRLHNGQWWPMQICAMRDGAHGEIEAGIHGRPGRGAFSVILSGGGYDDVDEGDRILYCGTSGTEGKATAGTNHLKETHKLKNPLRVLRSSALPQANPYRPQKGLRYDGLYDIVDYEIIDASTAMHRFSLKRRANQHPIRCMGDEARPTNEEVLEYLKIRHLLGIHSA